jgi:hypothetical protein
MESSKTSLMKIGPCEPNRDSARHDSSERPRIPLQLIEETRGLIPLPC